VLGELVGALERWNEGAHGSWGGQIEGDEPLLGSLFDHRMLTLQMPDGRQGEAIPTDYSVGSGAMDVLGSGPPPF
jgi:hypothetical protein